MAGDTAAQMEEAPKSVLCREARELAKQQACT